MLLNISIINNASLMGLFLDPPYTSWGGMAGVQGPGQERDSGAEAMGDGGISSAWLWMQAQE